MKKRWICLFTVLLLAVGVCTAKPVVSGASSASDAGSLVDRGCSLTVYPEDPNKQESDRFGEDLEEAGVVIDLYQVAKAVKVQGYDAYRYDVMSGYRLTIPDAPAPGEWEELAQEAAKAALQGEASGTQVKRAVPAGTKTDLEAGLYLAIARGSRLEQVSDYLTEVTLENEETGEESARLATIAGSSQYTYRFMPQLVSLPAKEADADGVISTGNPGDWVYDLSISLKPEQVLRFGSLQIVKSLSSYETEEGTLEPVTCVFEVTGVLNGETVYSNVESITFTAAGQESVTLDRIPALAQVTVREVYSGSSYELTVPGDRSAVIAADDVVSVDFDNAYTGERRKGHGIKNQFVYDADGGWQWYSDPPQNVNGNQGMPRTEVQ